MCPPVRHPHAVIPPGGSLPPLRRRRGRSVTGERADTQVGPYGFSFLIPNSSFLIDFLCRLRRKEALWITVPLTPCC